MPRVSGYVLAGGQSSRMGRDKALLRLNGVTLLELALRKLGAVCSDVAILCGTAERARALSGYGRVVVDRTPFCGPLGGMEAALQDAREERVLLMPVDVPLLPSALFPSMFACAGSVVCFESQQGVQPLPVLLRTALRGDITSAIVGGERKLQPLFRRLGLQTVAVEDASVFANANTPEEFAAMAKTSPAP